MEPQRTSNQGPLQVGNCLRSAAFASGFVGQLLRLVERSADSSSFCRTGSKPPLWIGSRYGAVQLALLAQTW